MPSIDDEPLVSPDGEGRPISTDNPLADIIETARTLGIDVSGWTFEQLMQVTQISREYRSELQERDAERAEKLQRFRAETMAREQELQLQARQAERSDVFQGRETLVRFTIALILVMGAVFGVLFGIIEGLNADEVAQYLAPITGLAGIAVGYFFGRASQ